MVCGPAELEAAPQPPAETEAVPDGLDLRELVGRLFGQDPTDDGNEQPGDGTRLFVFPTFGGNPALGFAMGSLLTLTNYWGDPETTTLSSLGVSATITTQKQFLLVARSDFYTPDNDWHLVGDWRFYRFSERTHGLGSATPSLPAADFNYHWTRIHQTVYRDVWAGFELGVGYHVDLHANVHLKGTQPAPTLEEHRPHAEPTTSSGLSANIIFDSRDNPINAEQGIYGRTSYTWYRTGLGSDDDWDSLQVEIRAFQRLPSARRQIVGVWASGWLSRGRDAPYFDLPSVGWDTYGRTGRGYRAGRFRGRDWVYLEGEYRTDLTANGLIGAVAFLNTSTLSGEDGAFQRWSPGGGAGVRVKLDKERRSNISIDLAWGRAGSKGLFLALNEAF